MLCFPAYAHERRPYPATLYLTCITLDSLLALTINAQRKTYGWCFTLCLWLARDFSCGYMFWDDRGGGLAGQPVGPLVGTATMTAVMSASRVDSWSFSSRCCTFRRTCTSADPIRLPCFRLALPSTLSLPSAFAPSERLSVGVPLRALWLAEI